jgi:hypothetical protein
MSSEARLIAALSLATSWYWLCVAFIVDEEELVEEVLELLLFSVVATALASNVKRPFSMLR